MTLQSTNKFCFTCVILHNETQLKVNNFSRDLLKNNYKDNYEFFPRFGIVESFESHGNQERRDYTHSPNDTSRTTATASNTDTSRPTGTAFNTDTHTDRADLPPVPLLKQRFSKLKSFCINSIVSHRDVLFLCGTFDFLNRSEHPDSSAVFDSSEHLDETELHDRSEVLDSIEHLNSSELFLIPIATKKIADKITISSAYKIAKNMLSDLRASRGQAECTASVECESLDKCSSLYKCEFATLDTPFTSKSFQIGHCISTTNEYSVYDTFWAKIISSPLRHAPLQ